MNKIFKSKWNITTQSYVACSELTKRAGKTAVGASLIAAALTLSPAAYAVDCTPEADGRYNVGFGGTSCEPFLTVQLHFQQVAIIGLH